MSSIKCQVLIVGAGPGGYVAAIRAGQLGLDVVIVEADAVGGTCLIRGCIPSKALIQAASRFDEVSDDSGVAKFGITFAAKPTLDMSALMDWKQSIVQKLSGGVTALLKKNKVKSVSGWATFRTAKYCVIETADGEVNIEAEHVILANGSVASEIPSVPFGANIISSSEALSLKELPERLLVIGAGYIGLELGIAFRKMGSKVTFIEGADRLLPTFDKEMTRPVETWLSNHDVEVITQAKVESAHDNSGGVSLSYTSKEGEDVAIAADKLLVTVGRRPALTGWGFENMCVDLDGQFIKIDDQCRTTMKNVWAIGDLVGEPMLAHKASAQGEMVAEIIAGERRGFDPVTIPAVCFTEPEIVGVGLDAKRAKAEGIETIVGKFPFSAVGKALSMGAGSDGGFVRITARADNHLVLGIHAVGSHVAELSNEFALAIEMGARLEDIANTIHVHPTLGEATMEAAKAGLGHAIHI